MLIATLVFVFKRAELHKTLGNKSKVRHKQTGKDVVETSGKKVTSKPSLCELTVVGL